VYQALTPPRNLTVWNQMVMVVTYDEHGGFFDHVSPLLVTADCGPGNEPFKSTGIRVPSFVVSPFVSPGDIYHNNLDHTSILEFLSEWLTPGTRTRRLSQIDLLSQDLTHLQDVGSYPPS
jgi:phospholipase C